MREITKLLTLAVVALIALGLTVLDATAQPLQCGGLHALMIMDLDMVPDPAVQGQPIQRWIVKLRADGNGECATRIMVRDRDQWAGNAVAFTLRPGLNVIPVPATPGYRMQGQDHCYTVLADIQGTQRPIDAGRQFCARMNPPRPPSWSLR
jgi:hypothetical protein